MQKDFDEWNEEKKRVEDYEQFDKELFPQEGEVWICILGKNIGREQNGGNEGFSRPVVVIKKFNNEMYWVVPLSSKQKHYDFYHNFIDGSGKEVSAIIAQMRLVSIKRFKRVLYQIENNVFSLICRKIKDFVP